MNQSEYTVYSPGSFIPLAESAVLTEPIEWPLDTIEAFNIGYFYLWIEFLPRVKAYTDYLYKLYELLSSERFY